MDMFWFSICFYRLFHMLLWIHVSICSWGTCFSQNRLAYIVININTFFPYSNYWLAEKLWSLELLMSPARAATIMKFLFAVEKERKCDRILKSSICQSDAIVHKRPQDCIGRASHTTTLNSRGQAVIPTMCSDGENTVGQQHPWNYFPLSLFFCLLWLVLLQHSSKHSGPTVLIPTLNNIYADDS